MHLYGRLEDGGTFLVRDDRQRPHFYIRAADAQRARALGAAGSQPIGRAHVRRRARRAHRGRGAGRRAGAARSAARRTASTRSRPTCASRSRYLIERGIKGGCEIEGEPRTSAERVSLDLRQSRCCGRRRSRSSRACCRSTSRPIPKASGCSRSRCTRRASTRCSSSTAARARCRRRPMRCADERAALDAFCERVRDARSRRAHRLEHDRLRSHGAAADRGARCGIRSSSAATRRACGCARPKATSAAARPAIPGRVVLDGIDLLRGAFVRMDDYSLDAVAREVLGEGKALDGDVRDRIGEILHNYRARPAGVRALRAHRRAARVSDRREAQSRARSRSRAASLTGMTPDRVAASIASFDFLYLARARAAPHRRADRALRRLARVRGAAGRSRARADHRAARERVGVRLQEPVSEPHPHVQHRSARATSPSPAPGRRSDRDAGRRVPARAGDPAAHARRAVPAARGGEASAATTWRRTPSRS